MLRRGSCSKWVRPKSKYEIRHGDILSPFRGTPFKDRVGGGIDTRDMYEGSDIRARDMYEVPLLQVFIIEPCQILNSVDGNALAWCRCRFR